MATAVLAAPTAMADIHIYVVDKAAIGHYGPTYVSESGPGDLSFSSVTGSPHASPEVGNESVKTGDISTTLKGGKGNAVVSEVEGSEQDSVKGEAEKASAEEGAAEEAAPKQAQQSEAAQQEESAPQQEQMEAAKQEDAAPQRAASDGKDGKGHHGDPRQVVKESAIGHNGPTLAAEAGPGDLSFSSVTASPHASPKVGNESVKTGDISTTLKGGKGNTVVNEVEGSEQDSVKGGAE
ncbi:hypothetical protein ACN3XK_10095 [Actinomadura welshii]